jgi:hypothetical protein
MQHFDITVNINAKYWCHIAHLLLMIGVSFCRKVVPNATGMALASGCASGGE